MLQEADLGRTGSASFLYCRRLCPWRDRTRSATEARRATGPEVYLLLCALWHLFVDEDVADLKPTAWLE